jgi:DNA polymerase I
VNLLPENLEVYLVDGFYNGHHKVNKLIFYSPETEKLYYIMSKKSHRPYCFTNVSPVELDELKTKTKVFDNAQVRIIKKWDALLEKEVMVTKIIVDDPSLIGNKKADLSIRDIIPKYLGEEAKVWEAKIPYLYCYIFDEKLEVGMPYKLINGKLKRVVNQKAEEKVAELIKKIGLHSGNLSRFVRFFEYDIPSFKRVAIDIEVLGEKRTKVPDANKAEFPVVSCCLIGSNGVRRELILLRKGVEVGNEDVDANIEFYDSEKDLLLAIFAGILEYPFIITFNGDNFDLTYLYNRAVKLGIEKNDIPIQLGRRCVKITGSIHIDLYRLFFNRSLRNYAFKQKYKNISLDEIGKALLGEGKVKIGPEGNLADKMHDWTYTQLAKYNVGDGDVTLQLTSYNEDLVMRLMMIIMRLASMTMEDMNRNAIGQWIRNVLFYEHRNRNYLIPNKEDILTIKGKACTSAMIKGKKYKGAIVVEPIAGIHFIVKVIDFASLYPTVQKVWNLGYASINCNHPECKSNKVPQTTHWVCKKVRAMESEIISMLRDLRVEHYKKLKKDPFYAVVEQAMKVILNASYGVFGDVNFDLYCPPVAESIASIARNSTELTIEKSKALGMRILYGDTDSVFAHKPTPEQVKALIDWSTKELQLDLEVDKEYRYVCLSSRKKNYVGVTIDGNVDVKGMTGKKKHVPIVIKEAFNVTKKYLAKAETPEEVEAVKKGVKKVVRNIYQKIKMRDFDLREMAFHMTLGKNLNMYEKSTPQHVKAARMLMNDGIVLRKGDVVSFIKIVDKTFVFRDKNIPEEVNVMPLQWATKQDVAVTKYHEMLKSTFEQLLDALGIEYDSILGETKLEKWM